MALSEMDDEKMGSKSGFEEVSRGFACLMSDRSKFHDFVAK